MKQYLNTILQGKCELRLKELPDNSVDSIVTDPPYGLEFMGKKWDYDVPSVAVWQECLRVLKPGGHLLSFAGTRTQHRMAVNIEDAGFEIRDMIAWVYGSGFPKSHNIGKAIDKSKGAERKIMGEGRWNSRKPKGSLGVSSVGMTTKKDYKETTPSTPEAQKYEGWGTALKPALEPITMARKPLSEKTIAANVLKWGTGGINIDACRISLRLKEPPSGSAKIWLKSNKFTEDKIYGNDKVTPDTGRFPANLIHDGHQLVLSLFPDEAGAFAPVASGKSGKSKGIYGDYNYKGDDGKTFHNDGLSSAARFFYCAKASTSERNAGLDDYNLFYTVNPVVNKKADTDRQNDSIDLANRLHNKNKQQNFHPTVKPLELMRYLCKLVTPAGGIVLDHYCGSGSTLVAAEIEGFQYIGIENEPEYILIANNRLNYYK